MAVRAGKIICSGLNYKDTVLEDGAKFPEKPLLVMVANQQDGYCFVACRGMTMVYPHHSSGSARITLTWADKALTWNYADLTNVNMDEKGDTYQVLALLEKGT